MKKLCYIYFKNRIQHNIKKYTLLFADHYNIIPIAIIDDEGVEHNVVLSSKLVQQLEDSLNSLKSLQLSLPDHNQYRSTNHIIRNIDIRSLAESGTVSQFLADRKHGQLNNDITANLNKDWTISSQQIYVVAKGFCGPIIINLENDRWLLVNTADVYDRDPTIETHHVLQYPTVSSKNKTSTPPSHGTRHKNFWVLTLHQVEGNRITKKLITDTNAFDALVTSSIRFDRPTEPECGPNTSNFILDNHTSRTCKFFVGDESWNDGLKIANDPNPEPIDPYFRLQQLRQLRIKFHRLDTYESSRASLLNGTLQLLIPYVKHYMFTLYCSFIWII